MSKLNVKIDRPQERTHEGAPAARIPAEQALRRSVMSCLLWEDEFYEDGEDISARIVRLCGEVEPDTVATIAETTRSIMNLRHVPLLMIAALAKHRALKSHHVWPVVQRADELAELLAIYAKLNGRAPDKVRAVATQLKRGLAVAFRKFDEYSLAKYDREGAIRLRDVMFLCRPKPKDEAQGEVWKRLADNRLGTPDTWEVALSAGGGKNKKEDWTRLLTEGKLGYFALLRNLRNMTQAGVDTGLLKEAIVARGKGAERVLPFRYIAAARACPQLEPAIDQALCETIAESKILDGKTVVLVDVSQSMTAQLSTKSDMTRMDAAAALASLINGDRRVFTFSEKLVEVPPRFGMAGVDAIRRSQPHMSTRLFDAVDEINRKVQYDRIIVITDEQATGAGVRFGHYIVGTVKAMPAPLSDRAYVINVASAKNGVGYGRWTHLDGFSEGVLRFIREIEAEVPEEAERPVGRRSAAEAMG